MQVVCSSIWPESRCLVFGSSFTSLALPGSDIDICVFTKFDSWARVEQHFECFCCPCCSSEENAGEETKDGLCEENPRCCCRLRKSRGSSRCRGFCYGRREEAFQEVLNIAQGAPDASSTFGRDLVKDRIYVRGSDACSKPKRAVCAEGISTNIAATPFCC